MRRALLAVSLSGLLLAGAACGSGGDSERETAAPVWEQAPTSAPPAEPAPDYSADTKKVCTKVNKIFATEVPQFGSAVGKMIAYKEAKQAEEAEQAREAASKELKEVGAKVRKETSAAQDPEVKAAGAASANKFTRSAADKKLFDGIKTTKDLDKALTAKMPEWMAPVAGLCAP
jgi:hypothetical protein